MISVAFSVLDIFEVSGQLALERKSANLHPIKCPYGMRTDLNREK
jgi:hypothetical protein